MTEHKNIECQDDISLSSFALPPTGRAGWKIILAGGKIILAGGEIILADGKIILEGGKIILAGQLGKLIQQVEGRLWPGDYEDVDGDVDDRAVHVCQLFQSSPQELSVCHNFHVCH